MRLILLIILINSYLFSFHEKEKIRTTDNNSIIEKTLNNIEVGLKYTYETLNISSKYIDEFLTNEKDDLIYQDSFIRYEFSATKSENTNLDTNPSLDVRLYLPKLKKKLQFNLNNNEDIISHEYEDSSEKLSNRDHSYNAGFVYNTLKDSINLSFKLGAKFSSDPYIFGQIGSFKIFNLDNKNDIILRQRFKYSEKYKLDNYSSFEYRYNIDDKLIFSNFNEYYINSDIREDNIYNSFRFYQILTKDKYLNYVASINSNDNKSNFKVKEYKAYISYRKYIREWLYYDVVPTINWEEKYNYENNLGVKLNLGIVIGK